tara:strand:+ start:1124 stop:2764 length:1641 start_codon:yes stop_codon:yes gene_type:complete
MIEPLPLTSPEEAARYRAEGLWPDETLTTTFRASAARHPDRICLIDGDRRFSYQTFAESVDRVAGNLLDLGIRTGDVVALQYRNASEMPLLHLACNRIGALYMPLHDSWREIELRHLLKLSRARVLVVPSEYRGFDHVAMAESIRGDLPDLEAVFIVGGTREGYKSFDVLLQPTRHSEADLDLHTPDPDAPAHIMLSGGTTALSKISRFSSNDLRAMLAITEHGSGFQQNDIAAALAPAGTGATGYVFPILMPLLHGATAAILDHWGDPEIAIQVIVEHRCTYAVGIPTQMVRMIPGLEKRRSDDFANFRCFINAGAPLAYETGLQIETLMNCKTHSIYGATDGGCPSCTSIHDPQEKRLRTVGRIVPGTECKLLGPDLRPVPAGGQGEIVWRGPQKSWGYLGDEAQTAAVFTVDRFYRSGDVGSFDADGYLQIVGRIKDMILRGGRNVFPALIEDLLQRHPSVLDVAVAAMPDPELGERACAFVVLHNGEALDFPEMVSFLKEQKIAVWQLPERLEIVEDLPKGPGGKVLKAALTAMVTEKLKSE